MLKLKEVAIKLLPYSEDEVTESKEEKIQIYLKIYANVSHPYLVKFLDCFNFSNSFLVFVTEFCDGGNLEDVIYHPHVPFLEKDIKLFLKQINLGISFLHEKKIYHGNLKPSNILINGGEIKISDYWLLKEILSDESLLGFEERAYYPPECQMNFINKEVDSSLDMWSVGLISYEMNFKTKPDKNLRFPNDASVRAKEFISKCLNEDKDKRWSSKQALESGYLSKN